MLIRTLLSFLVISVGAVSAADTTIAINAPVDAKIRIQRLEATFVTSDDFAGLANDVVLMSAGDYRIQLLSERGDEKSLAFFDLRVADNGGLELIQNRTRISSLIWGGGEYFVARATPTISRNQGSSSVTVTTKDGFKKSKILPFTDTTAWSGDAFKGNGRKKVQVNTKPEGAEIWLNGVKQPYKSNKAFFVPVSDSLRSRDSLVIRKQGYANSIIPLSGDEDQLNIDVVMQEIK